MHPASTAGRLLVATPAIDGGIFQQSVIFMLHHDPLGALGVRIDLPSTLEVEELLPGWADVVTTPAVIFTGGPVETNGFIGLARAIGAAPENSTAIDGTNLVTVDLDGDPVLTRAGIDRLRIFAGYAGWAPRQLDAELASGSWFTVAPEPEDLWSASAATLYEAVLLRQGGTLRWYANAPLDPSLN